MPQVKANVVDGWYRNDAKNAAGEPRVWSAATLTFKPGEVRFVPARARLESRSGNQAFEVALAKDLLVGPSATAKMDGVAAAPEPKKTPKPEAPAVEEPEAPVEEPETPAEEPTDPGVDMPVTEPAGEPEPEAKSAESKATKKRRGRSKS